MTYEEACQIEKEVAMRGKRTIRAEVTTFVSGTYGWSVKIIDRTSGTVRHEYKLFQFWASLGRRRYLA